MPHSTASLCVYDVYFDRPLRFLRKQKATETTVCIFVGDLRLCGEDIYLSLDRIRMESKGQRGSEEKSLDSLLSKIE